MNIKQTKEKLMKRYRALWTDWKLLDNNKMRRVENKDAKWLINRLIEVAFVAGLDRADEIVKGVIRDVMKQKYSCCIWCGGYNPPKKKHAQYCSIKCKKEALGQKVGKNN